MFDSLQIQNDVFTLLGFKVDLRNCKVNSESTNVSSNKNISLSGRGRRKRKFSEMIAEGKSDSDESDIEIVHRPTKRRRVISTNNSNNNVIGNKNNNIQMTGNSLHYINSKIDSIACSIQNDPENTEKVRIFTGKVYLN